MIVAHLSDLHLGFRAYGRIERGVDVRERDVAVAFERAVIELVRIGPQVVIVAGDVFDRPDPPAGAVVAIARGLESLRSSLPETMVLMVAGPRDTPRRPGDPGALEVLDTFPNVEAATGLPRSILIDRLGLHAALVPYEAALRHPPAVPESDPRMRWNLLVLHASDVRSGEAGVHVDPAEWDYIALGGEHKRRAVGAKARYCGSLERVALDPWDEAADEKGFLTVDLESGDVSFHPIPARPVVALAPVKVPTGNPDRLRARVKEVTGEIPGGIDGKIVRLRLQGATPADLLALQGEPLGGLRERALHLTVEAGKELRVPSGAWLPVDGARTVREAVLAELERDGLAGDSTRHIVELWIPESTEVSFQPLGDIESLDGELPGVGRVSTSIPLGLTAVIGGAGRSRRAVAELLLDAGAPPRVTCLSELWRGGHSETLEGAIRAAVDAVAESRGSGPIHEALVRAGASAGEPDPVTMPERRAVRMDPEQVASEFGSAAGDLQELRADVVEVDGDLEAAAMDWLRERQDAETTLQSYRDRARELRGRLRRMEAAGPDAPCPTCGRVLESHYSDVLTELREEWESVVQDGSWWKSRWEQLELKPSHLQEIELRSLRLHAALEAGSERVELLRARLGDLGPVAAANGGPEGGAEGAVISALRRVRGARETRARELVLDRASRFVARITGGRVLGITWDEGRAWLEGGLGRLSPLSEEDLAVARISVRMAAASLVSAGGRVLASLVIEEPFDRLDEEAQIRALVLMKKLVREIPRIVLFSRGEAVDARPELFDCVLEVREEGPGVGPALRPAAAGPGRLLLSEPARSARSPVSTGTGR